MTGILLDISGPLTSERIVRELKPHKDSGRVLDVGTGKGVNIEVLRDYGYEAYGIDLRHALNRDVRSFGVKGDVKRMPFGDGVFDAAVESLMFSQAFEIDKWMDAEYRVALREIRRTIVPGGIFISSWLRQAGMVSATGMSKFHRHAIEAGLKPLPTSERQMMVFQRALE